MSSTSSAPFPQQERARERSETLAPLILRRHAAVWALRAGGAVVQPGGPVASQSVGWRRIVLAGRACGGRLLVHGSSSTTPSSAARARERSSTWEGTRSCGSHRKCRTFAGRVQQGGRHPRRQRVCLLPRCGDVVRQPGGCAGCPGFRGGEGRPRRPSEFRDGRDLVRLIRPAPGKGPKRIHSLAEVGRSRLDGEVVGAAATAFHDRPRRLSLVPAHAAGVSESSIAVRCVSSVDGGG